MHEVISQEKLTETRHRTAAVLVAVFLLTIPFHETRILSDTSISVYRATHIPTVLLALLFFAKTRVRLSPLRPTLIISWFLSIWVLLTCFFSTDVGKSCSAWFSNIFQYSILSLVIFLCIKIMDHRQQRHFVFIANMMQFVGLILSASILLNFFFNFELEIFSTHTDANYTGSLIGGTFPTIMKVAIGLSMSMFLTSYYKQKRQMFKSYFSLLISSACLTSLFVSGGRVAGFIGLFLVIMTLIKQWHTSTKQRPHVSLGALILVITLLFTIRVIVLPFTSEICTGGEYDDPVGTKIERYLSLFDEVKTKQVQNNSSLGHRLYLLKEFERNFASDLNSLAFGVGFLQSYKYSELGLDPHNAFLSFFAETGIVGGLLFLALIVQIGRTIYKQYQNTPDTAFYLWISYLSMVFFFLSEATVRYSLIWQLLIPFAMFFEDGIQDTDAHQVYIL